MALPRFLVDRLESQGSLQLQEAESHHAARVLRMGVGEPCMLFDGNGHEAYGEIESVDKKSVRVTYHSRLFAPRDHDGKLHFGIAMPKGDRQRNVIEKLVELGVDRLTPLQTDRSVSKFDSAAIERLERYSIEACKQSHRNRLMQVDPSCTWEEWLTQVCSNKTESLWVLHPAHSDGRQDDTVAVSSESFLAADVIHSGRLVFAVGPEGGFTTSEIAQAVQNGFGVLDLGQRILRVETAVSFAAVLGSLRISSKPE